MNTPVSDATKLGLPSFIAVTGQECSGKDSYGTYLESLGYMHVSAGDVLRNRARAMGHSDPLSRLVLSQVGDAMKKEFGPSPIVESTVAEYELFKENFPAGLVISGLRRAGEIAAFKKHGAVVLWIDADDDKRFANQSHRARGDQLSREEFLERSRIEYYGSTGGGEDGVNIRAVEALADCRADGGESLQDLYKNSNEALRQAASA